VTNRIVQPPTQVPLTVDGKPVNQIWSLFFTALVSGAAPIVVIDPGASPFGYTAPFPGNVLISGGTVGSLSLTRARITLPLPMTSGFIPMAQGDVLAVTYSGAPQMWFIPNMGGAGGP